MKTFLFTVVAAILVLILAVVCLGIGWLITGKVKLRKRCGFTPKKKDDHCDYCGKHSSCDDDESERNNRKS